MRGDLRLSSTGSECLRLEAFFGSWKGENNSCESVKNPSGIVVEKQKLPTKTYLKGSESQSLSLSLSHKRPDDDDEASSDS